MTHWVMFDCSYNTNYTFLELDDCGLIARACEFYMFFFLDTAEPAPACGFMEVV